MLATLVVLRLQLPHQALAVLEGVDRATITPSSARCSPARGFAVPGQPGLRLRTVAEVVADAAANGVALRIDATKTQGRRRRAHRVGRRALVSGKRKQPTSKPTVCSDGAGARCGRGAAPGPPARPDRGQDPGHR